jgi:hypothetical protein
VAAAAAWGLAAIAAGWGLAAMPTAHASTYKVFVRLDGPVENQLDAYMTSKEDQGGKIYFGLHPGDGELRIHSHPGDEPGTVKLSAVILKHGVVVARPQVVTRLGMPAEISQSDERDPSRNFKLSLTPELLAN